MVISFHINAAIAGAVISGNIFTQSITGAAAAITLTSGTGQSNPWDSVGINNLKIENNTFYHWTIGIDVSGGLSPGGRGINAFNHVNQHQYIHHLQAFVFDKVAQDSKEEQHPFLHLPWVVESFPLRKLPDK